MEREPVVVEVTDADFERTVIEESHRRPVVVDLWAEWCGPCKVLGPILERVADERAGDFLLAKLDVDANPFTAQQFGVQSIPTVVAFRDGQPVSGFVGAYPEDAVIRFVDELLPKAADLEAAEAAEEARAGDVAGAEQGYREALASDPDNPQARLGLAELLVDRGDNAEAMELVRTLLPDPRAVRVGAIVEIAGWAEVDEPGTLASAKRLAAKGRWRDALEGMLGALGDDPSARDAMLDVFAAVGDDDPLVAEYRRKLASALF